jgi:hypothetical protein
VTIGRNLSRARSHIIFILALLATASYILWVENSRGRPGERTVRRGWQIEIGVFASAAAAGRQWDLLRERAAGLHPLDVAIVAKADHVLLRGEVESQETATALCASARDANLSCRVLSPGL